MLGRSAGHEYSKRRRYRAGPLASPLLREITGDGRQVLHRRRPDHGSHRSDPESGLDQSFVDRSEVRHRDGALRIEGDRELSLES